VNKNGSLSSNIVVVFADNTSIDMYYTIEQHKYSWLALRMLYVYMPINLK